MYDFEQTTEAAFTDVEVSVRETQTSYAEMTVKKQAIAAAEREVAYLEQRWQLLPDPNESAVLLIEDLLDAQERLADEERAFVTAQLGYALSWVQSESRWGFCCDSMIARRQPMRRFNNWMRRRADDDAGSATSRSLRDRPCNQPAALRTGWIQGIITCACSIAATLDTNNAEALQAHTRQLRSA